MSDTDGAAPPTIGELIAKKRKRRRPEMTQADLARLVGYKTVMISKIEAGTRVPSDDKLTAFAHALDVPLKDLRNATRPPMNRTSAQAVADAARLGAENITRAKELRRRQSEAQALAGRAADALQEHLMAIKDEIVSPFLEISSHVVSPPADLLVPDPVTTGSEESRAAELLNDTQQRTGGTLWHMLFAGASGAAAGTAAGLLTGAGAFAAVSTFATASTGAAIASLSGAAATSATLAWLGGGALAAGGAGIAGGTLALAGLTALPILGVGLPVFLSQGKRLAAEAEQTRHRLNQVEEDLQHNIEVIERFSQRVDVIGYATKFAVVRGKQYRMDLTRVTESQRTREFGKLTDAEQDALSALASLVTTTLTLAGLPIQLRVADVDVTAEPRPGADGNPAELPTVRALLDGGDVETNAFIDFAIAQAIGQIASR